MHDFMSLVAFGSIPKAVNSVRAAPHGPSLSADIVGHHFGADIVGNQGDKERGPAADTSQNMAWLGGREAMSYFWLMSACGAALRYSTSVRKTGAVIWRRI